MAHLQIDRRTSIASVWLLLATMLLLGGMLFASSWFARTATAERAAAEAWEDHAYAVIDSLSQARSATLSIDRGEHGYALTGDLPYLQRYATDRAILASEMPIIRQQLADNPVQTTRLDQLTLAIAEYLDQADLSVAAQRTGNHARAVAIIESDPGRRLTNRVLGLIDRIEATERHLLDKRDLRADIAAHRSGRFQDMLNVSGLLLLAIGAYSSLAMRRAIEREQAIRAELDRVATTDELTGLANRRELFSGLDRMIAASRRSGRPVAVAVLDLDHFKLVNDAHGHPVGDEVLRRVAEMARLLLRQQDLVGRIGGEEFLIAFPDCPATEAVAACERLRQGIAALPVLLPNGVALSVTISSGVAQLAAEDDRKTIIARADEALYQAKKAGRDQVRLAA